MTKLRSDVAKRSGLGVRDIGAMLKASREARAKDEDRAKRARRKSERQDPRPALPSPAEDAEWMPQMNALNDVIKASRERPPPARDIDGLTAFTDKIVVGKTHAFTSETANRSEGGNLDDRPADTRAMGDQAHVA